VKIEGVSGVRNEDYQDGVLGMKMRKEEKKRKNMRGRKKEEDS
jgi:hypothetical protein